MFVHAKEDVDSQTNHAGCCKLRSEVRDGFPLGYVFLVVQGKDDLGGVLEVLNWKSDGRIQSPTNIMESRRGQNWTISGVWFTWCTCTT